MEIKRINTPNAPRAAGHYSQATVYNGLVFVAGQLSIDPATSEKKLGSIEEQTEQALANVHAILKAAGSDWDR
jgi:2-iminobutanoate/2-iminopropanoate deaminase